LGSDKYREYEKCSKATALCLVRYFLTTNNQSAGVLSCRRNQLFHAHFSRYFFLTASLRQQGISTYFLFVYSVPFWNKLTWSVDHHRCLHGHVYAIQKQVFIITAYYHKLLQAFIMSMKEICVPESKMLYTHTSFCGQHFQMQ
jgi:hypothetical protein